MLATGNLPKGTTVSRLMHDLLGRAPGAVPGQPDRGAARPSLSPEASVEYMALLVRAHGGQDRRPPRTA